MKKRMNEEQKERIATAILAALLLGGVFGLLIGIFLGGIIF